MEYKIKGTKTFMDLALAVSASNCEEANLHLGHYVSHMAKCGHIPSGDYILGGADLEWALDKNDRVIKWLEKKGIVEGVSAIDKSLFRITVNGSVVRMDYGTWIICGVDTKDGTLFRATGLKAEGFMTDRQSRIFIKEV